MREQTRLYTSPAAQVRLASCAAVRSIRLKSRTLPTAARRTSMDRRPQVKPAHIDDPLRALVRVVNPVGEEHPEASVCNLKSFPRRPGRRLAVRSVVSAQLRLHSASVKRGGRPY
ncbi:hypothetical protein EVAR_88481_1 [Eumeta japonica]|uniref:Uncharacterized protein n=1 Tax=Eumeta variegata TaxID=151549 RepID=A0A4C1XR77_EUMVA|nr:hypothetical protein EVAR_88481_1 [Eumeta japonica]